MNTKAGGRGRGGGRKGVWAYDELICDLWKEGRKGRSPGNYLYIPLTYTSHQSDLREKRKREKKKDGKGARPT